VSRSPPSQSATSPYTPRHRAEKILTSKSALEGERKQVTVLFADRKGSMELLADRDPEEARKILDPVLELMMDAVHRYEGTVNQVMGDGIMALFGAPLDRPIVRAVPGERENRPGEAGVLRTAVLSTGPLSRLCSNRVAGLRTRAKAMSLDPNVWFENVELVAAQEIGEVTVMYVRNIYKYYVAYQLPRDQSQLL
jgi:class 3 adenylate cyclase